MSSTSIAGLQQFLLQRWTAKAFVWLMKIQLLLSLNLKHSLESWFCRQIVWIVLRPGWKNWHCFCRHQRLKMKWKTWQISFSTMSPHCWAIDIFRQLSTGCLTTLQENAHTARFTIQTFRQLRMIHSNHLIQTIPCTTWFSSPVYWLLCLFVQPLLSLPWDLLYGEGTNGG